MTNRDIYIAEKRARASALRDCTRLVAPDYQYQGNLPHKAMLGAASACDDAAEWAEGKTAQQFNSERFKP